MFDEMTVGKAVSYLGFVVGCAFITYIVRTMGYFSVVAPEYLGFFVETDLVMGAVRATPFVVGVIWLLYTEFWIVSLIHDNKERFPSIISVPVGRLAGIAPSWSMQAFEYFVIFCYFLSQFIPIGENYVFRRMIGMLISFILCLKAVEQFERFGTVNPFSAFATLLVVYTTLHDVGKWEAVVDLNHSKARYSITASDKSYVNVLLLRASASSVLLKVGSQVVLYERSKIIRIERTADAGVAVQTPEKKF